MAVTDTKLIWHGQTATFSEGMNREYIAVYHVYVDDVNDGPLTVALDFNGPDLGETYAIGNDQDDDAQCVSIDPRRVDGTRLIWEVVTKYKTDTTSTAGNKAGRNNADEKTDDPLEFRDELEIQNSDYLAPVEEAIYHSGFKGQAAALRPAGTLGPVVNSTLTVPFDPPLEKDENRVVIRITKNKRFFPYPHIEEYAKKVNSVDWRLNKLASHGFAWTFKAKEAKMHSITGSYNRQNNVNFWKVTYEIHINHIRNGKGGWRDFVVDRGRCRRALPGDPDGHGGTFSMATAKNEGLPDVIKNNDRFGNPIDDPVLLDGDGQPLAAGDPTVYLEYQKYEEIIFPNLD